MIFSVSAVLFTGVLLALLVRDRKSTPFTACVGVTFGFLLASTTSAPTIRDLLTSAASLLNHVGGA